ncbi:MAG: hypothetical protein PHS41_05530 [Victivallaceae bacterium]|nr:hypothetical protein [Victivallaceae bacterium]
MNPTRNFRRIWEWNGKTTLWILLAAIVALPVLCAAEPAPKTERKNLVVNPNFSIADTRAAGGLKNWTCQVRGDRAGNKPHADFKVVPSGEENVNAMRISVPLPGKTGKAAAVCFQLIKLKPDTEYYVSCRRKKKATWAPVFFDLRDQNKKFVSVFGLTQTEKSEPDCFELCEKSFRTGKEIHYGQIMLTIQNLGAGEAEFCEPVLMEVR